nr:VWA domain-containing protein [uncultured Psychrobacter sp.]
MLIQLLDKAKGVLNATVPVGIKAFKYFIDSTLRPKVEPIAGSVVYSDLWVAVEHSGIYIDEGKIANIVVDRFTQSTVLLNDPEEFTSKSKLGKKIYVSCDKHSHSVGDTSVASAAYNCLGQEYYYNLILKNCHQFSTKCVNQKVSNATDTSVSDIIMKMLPSETWEPTLRALKNAANKKLGANKWLLWDWDNDARNEPEPDWQAHRDYFENLTLTPESIETIKQQHIQTQAYLDEISDEGLPKPIIKKLVDHKVLMSDIADTYEQHKNLIALCPGADFSYAQLKKVKVDSSKISQILKDSQQIKELVKKLGRNHISEEKKKQSKIPAMSKSEVHGTHLSDDLLRLLPTELVNLEDETLEYLFYSRMLEKQLITYELSGTELIDGETTERQKKSTGPVVACLDTSGSMHGEPLLYAKALLIAVANILKTEKRSLHVLLFGSQGQLSEFAMSDNQNIAELLVFLQSGFNGGTDFETPLSRALEIIKSSDDYVKADILMITDGLCQISGSFKQQLIKSKSALDCSIYTVLCAGRASKDAFSDEVIVLDANM